MKTATQKYLETFFEEKALAERTYEVEHNGMLHFIQTDFVINLVKSCSKGEQEKIANILRKIDFANGDVHHFLNHLATGYVVSNY
jgi:hypothetical protein